MKKIKLSLITLNKETVSKLQDDQMQSIRGGNVNSSNTQPSYTCKYVGDRCKPVID